jgi:hypothetical protein
MKIVTWLKKTTLAGLLAVLILTALPLSAAYAAGDPLPPVADGELTGERLERVWARRQRAYARLGRILERADGMIDRAQGLLDKAESEGKDVSALQAALEAFAEAVEDAQVVYDEAIAIVDSHAGFDDEGKVTDEGLAAETVRQLAEKLEQVRDLIGRPGRVLHEALKAFREAARPPARPDN